MSYSPCGSDEFELIIADEQIASDLSSRHDQLTAAQKTLLFGTEAYYRLAFILGKYNLSISMEAAGDRPDFDDHVSIFMLLSSLTLIGIGYGIKKRE